MAGPIRKPTGFAVAWPVRPLTVAAASAATMVPIKSARRTKTRRLTKAETDFLFIYEITSAFGEPTPLLSTRENWASAYVENSIFLKKVTGFTLERARRPAFAKASAWLTAALTTSEPETERFFRSADHLAAGPNREEVSIGHN